MDAERRAALLGAKLGALVASRGEPGPVEPRPFGGGAALVAGEGGWVLTEYPMSLGPALAWARSAGVARVDVVTETNSGVLARQAGFFVTPVRVWTVLERILVEAIAEPLEPEPLLDPAVAAYAGPLRDAGCDPVAEQGRLLGEVEGLEVVRVSATPDGPLVEVGVGQYDREAHALLSHDRALLDVLRAVVELVRRSRHPGAPPTPLQRLAPERRLRTHVVADPALVGAASLRPAVPTHPAANLRTTAPAPAVGVDLEGRPLVVVCSTGIDLDLVPVAADDRSVQPPGARLVLAVPYRDAVPVTRALAASLVEPAEVVGVVDMA